MTARYFDPYGRPSATMPPASALLPEEPVPPHERRPFALPAHAYLHVHPLAPHAPAMTGFECVRRPGLAAPPATPPIISTALPVPLRPAAPLVPGLPPRPTLAAPTQQTPAQAAGFPDFVTDVPVQGPTDEGLRAAACWWVQHRTPQTPPCVDCTGPLPGWTQRAAPIPALRDSRIAPSGQGPVIPSGVGAPVLKSGGCGCQATDSFLGQAPGDVFSTLSAVQRDWVRNVLRALNAQIAKTTSSSCPGWQDPSSSVNLPTGAVRCFQLWFNASSPPPAAALRTDGVMDAPTLAAMQATAVSHVKELPQFPPVSVSVPVPPSAPAAVPIPTPAPPPAAAPIPVPAPPPAPETAAVPVPAPAPAAPIPVPMPPTAPPAMQVQAPAAVPASGLSTGAKIGIGVAGVAVVGGVIFVATRGGAGQRRNGKRRR